MAKRVKSWDKISYTDKLLLLAQHAEYEGIVGRSKLVNLVYETMNHLDMLPATPLASPCGVINDFGAFLNGGSGIDLVACFPKRPTGYFELVELLLSPHPVGIMKDIISHLRFVNGAGKAVTGYLLLDYPNEEPEPAKSYHKYWSMLQIYHTKAYQGEYRSDDDLQAALVKMTCDDLQSIISAMAIYALHFVEPRQIDHGYQLTEFSELPITILSRVITSQPTLLNTDEESVASFRQLSAIYELCTMGPNPNITGDSTPNLLIAAGYHFGSSDCSSLNDNVFKLAHSLLWARPTYGASKYHVIMHTYRALTLMYSIFHSLFDWDEHVMTECISKTIIYDRIISNS